MVNGQIEENKLYIISGSPGSGKSSIIKALTEKSDVPVIHIQCTTDMDESELFGQVRLKKENGTFSAYFEDGLLTKAIKKGNAVILEDADKLNIHIIQHLKNILKKQFTPPGSNEIITPNPAFLMALSVSSSEQNVILHQVPLNGRILNIFDISDVLKDPQILHRQFKGLGINNISSNISYFMGKSSILENESSQSLKNKNN